MVVAAGDYFPGTRIRQLRKANPDSSITKGCLMYETSNNWTITPTSSVKGPFAVCARAPASTDTTVDAIRGNAIVYLVAGGTIQPGQFVVNDTGTAGQVIAYVATSIPTTPLQADVQNARDEFSRIVGVYEGHENENSLNNAPTAAASTDVIRVQLTGTSV